MARIFTAGNELANPTHEGWYWDESGTAAYPSVSQSGGFRSTEQNGGDYYYYLPESWDLKHFPRTFGKPASFPVADTFGELYVRFHFHASSSVSGERSILSFVGGDDTTYFTASIYDSGGSGTAGASAGIRLRETIYSGTAHISTGAVFQNNTWNLFEFRCKLGSGGTGLLEVRVNEVVVSSVTGTFVGPSSQTSMAGIHLRNTQHGGAIAVNRFDDFAINDTSGTLNNSWPGEGYVVLRIPHKDGAATNLATDIDAGGVNNAERIGVEDLRRRSGLDHLNRVVGGPNSVSARRFRHPGFVTPTAVPQKDTYAIKQLPFDAGTINAISIFSRGIGRGPLAGNVRHLIKPPAQTEIQSAQIALNSIERESSVTHLNENSNTSAAFTVSEVNGMELGIQFEA